jgi:hypothetical protein
MEWIAAAIIGLGIYVQWTRWQQRRSAARGTPCPATDAKTHQEEVAEAITANDLERMQRLLPQISDPLLQHALMTHMVAIAHKGRKDENMRRLLKTVARTYVADFDGIGPQLQTQEQEIKDKAPIFKWLAIVLEEEGEYTELLALCHTALDWELEDGTKTGYRGRIQRIQKKMQRADAQ